MSVLLGTELWDKPESIITFNENNSIIIDKFQKVITDYLKANLIISISQKKIFEKYLSDNESLKTSQFFFASNSYFLTEEIFELINANETFSESLLTEFDDVIKTKCSNIKKDTRVLKFEVKTLSDDLARKNQKLDNDFKRYRTRFNTKEVAYNAYIKADANKSLSRNQVESYHTTYTSRKKQYELAKAEYLTTLENFNKYQIKHYSSLLGEWGQRAQNVEVERYNSLRSTFTNLLEVCRSMASKFNNIADKIESKIETIDCNKDFLTLINQEKSDDVPPQDVPFKDFDIQDKNDIIINEDVDIKKTSISGSEYSSVINTNKSSIPEISKSARSQSLGIISFGQKESNSSTNGGITFFGKLFTGTKRTKEPIKENIQSEVEQFETLDEKGNQSVKNELKPEINQEVNDIKNNLESSKNDCSKPKNCNSTNKLDSQIVNSEKETIYENVTSTQEPHVMSTKETSLFRRLSRSSMRILNDNRRSQSVVSITIEEDKEKNVGDYSTTNDKFQTMLRSKTSHSKGSQKPSMRAQSISGKREYKAKFKRFGSGTINSRCIEVIRNECKVEIVSTPAEALACAARESCLLASEQDIYDEISPDNINQPKCNITYDYYYVGSCVAMHAYQSTDPSTIYLSFEIGQQFYIIQEDNTNESSGWLLVEKIDRSQLGYVPASYMDTRQFDVPVRIYSDHPMVLL